MTRPASDSFLAGLDGKDEYSVPVQDVRSTLYARSDLVSYQVHRDVLRTVVSILWILIRWKYGHLTPYVSTNTPRIVNWYTLAELMIDNDRTSPEKGDRTHRNPPLRACLRCIVALKPESAPVHTIIREVLRRWKLEREQITTCNKISYRTKN